MSQLLRKQKHHCKPVPAASGWCSGQTILLDTSGALSQHATAGSWVEAGEKANTCLKKPDSKRTSFPSWTESRSDNNCVVPSLEEADPTKDFQVIGPEGPGSVKDHVLAVCRSLSLPKPISLQGQVRLDSVKGFLCKLLSPFNKAPSPAKTHGRDSSQLYFTLMTTQCFFKSDCSRKD